MNTLSELHALFGAMAQGDRQALVARVAEVQCWVDSFSASLAMKAPRVKVGLYAAYAPLSHSMSLSLPQLQTMRDDVLRIIVAHEVGHAKRRLRSILAITTIARLDEEVAADRVAYGLTRCGIDAWDEAMRDAEASEPPESDVDRHFQDLVWQGRRKKLAAFIRSSAS